jgi:chromosome segregation ATPase
MEILKQITEGFLKEKSLSGELVKERISDLNQYLKLLDLAIVKVAEVSLSHKKEVESLLAEKSVHQKDLNDIKDAHNNELKSHSEKIAAKEIHSGNLDSDIKAKESKIVELDKRIDDLRAEYTSIESSVATIRLQLVTMERNLRDFQGQEASLKKSIEDLSGSEAKVTESVESKKKEVTRLSNDEAVLKARKKK